MSIAYNPGMKAQSHAHAPTNVLSLRGVTFRYARGQAALGPLDLTVGDGEFVCVVGPSGSGKSTLLGLLSGFLRPESGVLEFDGRTLQGPDNALTLVQQEHALFPWRTVLGNVEFGLEMRRVSREERRRRALAALELVSLGELAGRRVHERPGGRRQRWGIVRAFAIDPSLLLLDEPFSALGVGTGNTLGDELVRLWRETGKTVLFVTHNLDEALRLGQRVVALREGRVALDRSAASLTLSDLEAVFR